MTLFFQERLRLLAVALNYQIFGLECANDAILQEMNHVLLRHQPFVFDDCLLQCHFSCFLLLCSFLIPVGILAQKEVDLLWLALWRLLRLLRLVFAWLVGLRRVRGQGNLSFWHPFLRTIRIEHYSTIDYLEILLRVLVQASRQHELIMSRPLRVHDVLLFPRVLWLDLADLVQQLILFIADTAEVPTQMLEIVVFIEAEARLLQVSVLVDFWSTKPGNILIKNALLVGLPLHLPFLLRLCSLRGSKRLDLFCLPLLLLFLFFSVLRFGSLFGFILFLLLWLLLICRFNALGRQEPLHLHLFDLIDRLVEKCNLLVVRKLQLPAEGFHEHVRVHMTSSEVLWLALVNQALHLLLLLPEHLLRIVFVDFIRVVHFQVLIVHLDDATSDLLALLILQHCHFFHEDANHRLGSRQYPLKSSAL